jgi:hypothetical protein
MLWAEPSGLRFGGDADGDRGLRGKDGFQDLPDGLGALGIGGENGKGGVRQRLALDCIRDGGSSRNAVGGSAAPFGLAHVSAAVIGREVPHSRLPPAFTASYSLSNASSFMISSSWTLASSPTMRHDFARNECLTVKRENARPLNEGCARTTSG